MTEFLERADKLLKERIALPAGHAPAVPASRPSVPAPAARPLPSNSESSTLVS
jgi:hypothetical protein